MAKSPIVNARIPHPLAEAARAGSPELEGLAVSELLRAGLAVLAGHSVRDAVEIARGVRGQVLTVPEPLEVKVAKEGQPA